MPSLGEVASSVAQGCAECRKEMCVEGRDSGSERRGQRQKHQKSRVSKALVTEYRQREAAEQKGCDGPWLWLRHRITTISQWRRLGGQKEVTWTCIRWRCLH